MAFNFDSDASTPPYVAIEEEVDFSTDDFSTDDFSNENDFPSENDFLGLEVEDFALDKSADGLPSLADWSFGPISTSTPLMPPKRELLDAVSTSTTAATPPLRILQPQQQQHWQQPTFYATAAPQYFMAPMYSAPVAQPSNPQIHINATHGNVQVKVSQPPPQQPHYLPPPHGLCASSCCQLMPYGGYVSYGLGQEHVVYAPANDFTTAHGSLSSSGFSPDTPDSDPAPNVSSDVLGEFFVQHPFGRAATPTRASKREAKMKDKASTSIQANNECANCGTTTTTLWRRSDIGEIECNACNLYYRKNGRKRPLNLQKRGIMKRNRRPRLPYGQQIAEARLAAQMTSTPAAPAPATVQLLDAGVVSQELMPASSAYFEY